MRGNDLKLILHLNLSLLQLVFSVLAVVVLNKKEKDSQNLSTEIQYSIRWIKNLTEMLGLLQLTIRGTKSAMLEGKLIIIPALGHQNKGKSNFTGSGLFVLMSQCGNNNELAVQHGGFCTSRSLVAKGLLND